MSRDVPEVDQEVVELINSISQYPPDDKRLIKDALKIALFAHEGDFRKNQKDKNDNPLPYIYHPLCVTNRTLATIREDGLPSPPAWVIGAALLHDVPEDSRHTITTGRNTFRIIHAPQNTNYRFSWSRDTR